MKQELQIEVQRKETNEQALARTVTSPECLSASVLTICQNIEHSEINEVVTELRRQSAAIHVDDLSRAESMLTAQAHTLDGLFARLTTNALTAKQLNSFESYMKLALRAQNQSRATLQTLIELKAPKQIAFVKQANIGNQVQVNNNSARAGKKQKEPNELLEVHHGERLDTRATSKTSRADQTVATMEKQHRTDKR